MVDKKLCNRRSLILPSPDLLITTDVSTKGWGASCNHGKVSMGGPWLKGEQKCLIYVLEMKAVKSRLLTFTKFRNV